jgi:hypothetical protein
MKKLIVLLLALLIVPAQFGADINSGFRRTHTLGWTMDRKVDFYRVYIQNNELTPVVYRTTANRFKITITTRGRFRAYITGVKDGVESAPSDLLIWEGGVLRPVIIPRPSITDY